MRFFSVMSLERDLGPFLRRKVVQFRVARLLADGKVEPSLRVPAHEQIAADAEGVLLVLSRPGAPKDGDRSNPDQIRSRFGLSKKASKRAVGRLLKLGAAAIDQDGLVTTRRR